MTPASSDSASTGAVASKSPIRVETLAGGAVRRVVLAAPKGNVIDAAMVAALLPVVNQVAAEPTLKAVILEGDGAHFSFGASVAEHLPESVEAMLRGFHGLLKAVVASPVPWIAAVRGRCLGGGLELACACHRIVADPTAVLGQPELSLGVFAPAASVLLPERVGRPCAEDLCLTGRTVAADDALRMGLVDELAGDPTAAALRWVETHLAPKSASSLRFAVRALRLGFSTRVAARLDDVERLYLGSLTLTHDADEGIRAFLEKRPPRWKDE